MPPDRSRSSWPSSLLAASLLMVGTVFVPSVAPAAGNQNPAGIAGGAAGQLVTPPVDEMTRNLIALTARYHNGPVEQQPELLAALIEAASLRQQLLAALVEDSPADVLRVALPGSVRDKLPPAAQSYVEGEVDAEGELAVAVEDRLTGSTVHYRLKTNQGEDLSLHFAGEPPQDLLTGSRVRVHGVRVDGALALGPSSTSVSTLAAALPNTFGEQKTIVILVNFQDSTTQPYSVATAQSVVFSATSNFDYENSFQQTWLTGDVYGWFTIPMSSTVCDRTTLANHANQAATAAGAILSNYNRYVYAFPQNACAWWGFGSVGGNPSQAWVNGSLELMVVGHEMGHNLGLSHSHSLDCGATVIGTNCTSSEYGDTLDIMGNSQPAHFNAFQKERLGWLNYGGSPPATEVQASGSYWIDPYESLTYNPKALKIIKSTDPTTGARTWYYVEFRQPLGSDGFVSGYPNVMNGVVIHTGSESSGLTSYLLDMTPATDSFMDPALDVGQSFFDPDAGVTISLLSASSAGANVSVTLGPVVCVSSNPTVSVSPPQSPAVMPGSTVTYTVSVTNNDSSSCTASNFNLQATVPSGWSAAFAASALSPNPGSTASTTLQVTSTTTAAAGSYTFTVGATNAEGPTFTAATSAAYLVALPLDVKVSTDKGTYSRGQTATITVTVKSGGSPAANATVNFTITRSNGTVVTASAQTGRNGTATYKLRLGKQDPVGRYQVQAQASLQGVTGSASTSFTVQ